jgi:uncharacterized glyoxalase superfamily protein PhnB
MPHSLKSVTPNLLVADVSRSIAFYREVLGFDVETTVPDAAPFVFAIVRTGDVRIFLNEATVATQEYPAFAGRPIGGSLTLFVDVSDVRGLHEAVKDRVTIVMPLEHKWYGLTEFAITDPDGWVITFAQRD